MIVNSNPNLQQTMQMLAETQHIIATSLNEKDKESSHKPSKRSIKCHGDKKATNRNKLIRLAWKVRQWSKNKCLMVKCLTCVGLMH